MILHNIIAVSSVKCTTTHKICVYVPCFVLAMIASVALYALVCSRPDRTERGVTYKQMI